MNALNQKKLIVQINTVYYQDYLDGYVIHPQEGLGITAPKRFSNLWDAKEWAIDNYSPIYDFVVDSDEEDFEIVSV